MIQIIKYTALGKEHMNKPARPHDANITHANVVALGPRLHSGYGTCALTRAGHRSLLHHKRSLFDKLANSCMHETIQTTGAQLPRRLRGTCLS